MFHLNAITQKKLHICTKKWLLYLVTYYLISKIVCLVQKLILISVIIYNLITY